MTNGIPRMALPTPIPHRLLRRCSHYRWLSRGATCVRASGQDALMLPAIPTRRVRLLLLLKISFRIRLDSIHSIARSSKPCLNEPHHRRNDVALTRKEANLRLVVSPRPRLCFLLVNASRREGHLLPSKRFSLPKASLGLRRACLKAATMRFTVHNMPDARRTRRQSPG